jgi:flagellar basal body-associated protein FliL
MDPTQSPQINNPSSQPLSQDSQPNVPLQLSVQPVTQNNTTKRKTVTLIVGVVLLLGLGIAGYLVFGNKPSASSPSKNSVTATDKVETELYSFTSDLTIKKDDGVDRTYISDKIDYYNIGTAGRIVVTPVSLDDYVKSAVISSVSDAQVSSKVNTKELKTALNQSCSNPKNISVSGSIGTVQLLSGTAQYAGCYLLTAVNKKNDAVTLYISYPPENTNVANIAKTVAESFSLK